MTDEELRDLLDYEFFPFVANPSVRAVLVNAAARVAHEHADPTEWPGADGT